MTTRIKLIAILAIAAAARAGAQCGQGGPSAPTPKPGAIVGLITDDRNYPLESVDVMLAKPRRKVSTNSRGQFTITDLEPGTYPIVVRRIGYQPQMVSIDVTKDGASARICVDVEAERLAPLVTSISRGGISGKVFDSSYTALADAEVHAIGSNKTATTDSSGAFFIDVRPGTYGVQVTKKGFGTRVVAVKVPKDSGRSVSVWLHPMNAGMSRRMAASLAEMKWRMLTQGSGHTLLTGEDLMNTSRDLAQVVAQRAVTKYNDGCSAVVNGMYVLPLYAVDKSDIELMEVYPTSMFSRRANAQSANMPMTTRPQTTSSCGAIIYLWTRR